MKAYFVEDSEVILEHLRSLAVQVSGLKLVGASGDQERAILDIAALQPDVVTLDLALKPGSGITVLRWIKLKYPAIRVIVLTNRSEAQYRKICMALGAEHFLDKSLDIEKLGPLLADMQTVYQ